MRLSFSRARYSYVLYPFSRWVVHLLVRMVPPYLSVDVLPRFFPEWIIPSFRVGIMYLFAHIIRPVLLHFNTGFLRPLCMPFSRSCIACLPAPLWTYVFHLFVMSVLIYVLTSSYRSGLCMYVFVIALCLDCWRHSSCHDYVLLCFCLSFCVSVCISVHLLVCLLAFLYWFRPFFMSWCVPWFMSVVCSSFLIVYIYFGIYLPLLELYVYLFIHLLMLRVIVFVMCTWRRSGFTGYFRYALILLCFYVVINEASSSRMCSFVVRNWCVSVFRSVFMHLGVIYLCRYFVLCVGVLSLWTLMFDRYFWRCSWIWACICIALSIDL